MLSYTFHYIQNAGMNHITPLYCRRTPPAFLLDPFQDVCVCAYGLQPAPVLFAMCTDEAEKEQHAVSHTHLPKQNKSLLAVKSTPVCMHWAQEERGKQRKWTQRKRRKGEWESADEDGGGRKKEDEQRRGRKRNVKWEEAERTLWGWKRKLKVEEIHCLIHKHLDDGANFLAIS